MKTRRQFFRTLCRSVATAAAVVYAPGVLAQPRWIRPKSVEVTYTPMYEINCDTGAVRVFDEDAKVWVPVEPLAKGQMYMDPKTRELWRWRGGRWVMKKVPPRRMSFSETATHMKATP